MVRNLRVCRVSFPMYVVGVGWGGGGGGGEVHSVGILLNRGMRVGNKLSVPNG